jgi:anthranilate/para-aminobenzoate synthase component I
MGSCRLTCGNKIAIRTTTFLTPRFHAQKHAGIVFDSHPASEVLATTW